MDAYSKIEKLVADRYGKSTTTRKAVGDFMLTDTYAVNVKSNNVAKQNYSPNMISIQKMHKWVFEERHDLSFIFVDYKEQGDQLEILSESDPIPIEHISWDCVLPQLNLEKASVWVRTTLTEVFHEQDPDLDASSLHPSGEGLHPQTAFAGGHAGLRFVR